MANKVKKSERGQDIIKNMGLFWTRDKIMWRGTKKDPKGLTGVRTHAKTSGPVDFWSQTGIYALYADYHLVYVGQAGLTDKSCIGSRLKAHLSNDLAGRWNMFSWFGLQAVLKSNRLGKRGEVKLTSRAHLANVLEGIVIEIAEPPMNNQKGRFGDKVERYLQVDKRPKLEESLDKKIDALNKKIDSLGKAIHR